MPPGTPVFPGGFLWGVATSAPQIEGGVPGDGRGESVWDRFAAAPGRIADGSDLSVACDSLLRWREDIERMRWLGVGAYRFSIAWPRVMPSGAGPVSEAGLDYYDALVDGLVAARIEPFVTLYHWDLPQALEERGGWRERDTAARFVDYVTAVTARLGDRVRFWATHNEPWCVATLGHEEGHHAPGLRDPMAALRAAHHLLLSHGWAAEAIRRSSPGAQVGIVLILSPVHAATTSQVDGDAARRLDARMNRWYLDPLFRGRYPEDGIADRVRRGHLAGPELPFVREGDLRAIAAPLDFLGINYYSRSVVRADGEGEPVAVRVVPAEELTDMGWEVWPRGLHDMLVRVHREYRPPRIYITENGAAYPDPADPADRLADPRRLDYLRSHLVAARRALDDGVPLLGYFVWSLIDNFEWAHGYTRRFGLFHVDFETQRRTPRESARWYRDVVRANALPAAVRQLS